MEKTKLIAGALAGRFAANKIGLMPLARMIRGDEVPTPQMSKVATVLHGMLDGEEKRKLTMSAIGALMRSEGVEEEHLVSLIGRFSPLLGIPAPTNLDQLADQVHTIAGSLGNVQQPSETNIFSSCPTCGRSS